MRGLREETTISTPRKEALGGTTCRSLTSNVQPPDCEEQMSVVCAVAV